MDGYSSTSSLVFIAFGVVYGFGFLIAAWVIVRRLLRQQKEFDRTSQNPGTLEPGTRNAPTIAQKPVAKPDPKDQPPVDLGTPDGVDGF